MAAILKAGAFSIALKKLQRQMATRRELGCSPFIFKDNSMAQGFQFLDHIIRESWPRSMTKVCIPKDKDKMRLIMLLANASTTEFKKLMKSPVPFPSRSLVQISSIRLHRWRIIKSMEFRSDIISPTKVMVQNSFPWPPFIVPLQFMNIIIQSFLSFFDRVVELGQRLAQCLGA